MSKRVLKAAVPVRLSGFAAKAGLCSNCNRVQKKAQYAMFCPGPHGNIFCVRRDKAIFCLRRDKAIFCLWRDKAIFCLKPDKVIFLPEAGQGHIFA